jgi:integrase
MGALTDVKLRQWTRKGQPVARADGGGLTFTLSAKGTAAWTLRYRFGRKPRELTLGRYPDIGLAKARELATAERAKIQQGADPARDKQQAKHTAATAKTYHQLALDYMEKVFPRLAENTVKQRGQQIRKLILPKLGHFAARDVTTADVVALVESVGKRSPNVAELVLTAVSEIFKHGLARHVVTSNPCAGISVSAICGDRVPKRPRLKLTEEELRAILPALPTIGETNALAAKILLVTCTRIGELARARWDDIDLDRAEWRIPDANSKTGRGFTVPLPASAVQWFEALKPFACGSPFVLPARQERRRAHLGDVPFEQRSLNAQLHKLCDRLGEKVRRFTPHDLRSTARSHLAALGVSVIVAERCLNHALGGLLAVYDQHDSLTERRAALKLWADLVSACETNHPWKADNVVGIKRNTAA